MPTIVEVDGGKIAMYPGDHNPPHFHLRGPDYEATYTIKERKLLKISGKAPRATQRKALAWASEHETELLAKWAELNEQDG